MKWVNDLSEHARSLLERERELGRETPERHQRVLARARAVPRRTEAPQRRAFWLRPGQLLAATLVLVLAAVSYAAWQRTRSAVRSPTIATRPAVTPSSERQAPLAASPAVMSAPGAHADKTDPARPRKVDPAPAASQSPTAAYALELAVLEPARAAVAKGDHASALRAIANHERRFPTGILREEREALRVKALSGLGKADQARQAAERFRERFPRSVLAPSLDEAVKKAR